MIASMIRAVIFDLDGTLIHSLPGLANSLNRVLGKNNLPTHSEHAVRSFIGDGIIKLVERATPNGLDHGEILRLTDEMKADYAATWETGSPPYPGTLEVLQTLTRHQIGIAVFSNKPDIYCKKITDHVFPGIHFARVLGQRQGVPVKPAPDGALEVAKSLNVDAGEIAFVGDSTMDLQTAHNAGMTAVAATWGYHDTPALAAQNPHHTITHISELLPILNI